MKTGKCLQKFNHLQPRKVFKYLSDIRLMLLETSEDVDYQNIQERRFHL